MDDQASPETSPVPPLVRQSHGGALYRGGVPRNRSHSGRTSKVREIALEGLGEATPKLVKIAKGAEGVSHSDQVAAFRVLANVCLGQTMSLVEVRERLQQLIEQTFEWAKEYGIPEAAIEALNTRHSSAWKG